MSSAGSAVAGSGTAWKTGQRADSPGGLERHPALLPGRAGFQSLSNPNGPAATLTRRLSFLLPCPRLRLEQQFRTLEFSGKFSKTDSPRPESEAAAGATATSSCCCKVPPQDPCHRFRRQREPPAGEPPAGVLADRPAHRRPDPEARWATLTSTRSRVCPGFVLYRTFCQRPAPPRPVPPGSQLCTLPGSRGGSTEPRWGCPQGSAVRLGVTLTSRAHNKPLPCRIPGASFWASLSPPAHAPPPNWSPHILT